MNISLRSLIVLITFFVSFNLRSSTPNPPVIADVECFLKGAFFPVTVPLRAFIFFSEHFLKLDSEKEDKKRSCDGFFCTCGFEHNRLKACCSLPFYHGLSTRCSHGKIVWHHGPSRCSHGNYRIEQRKMRTVFFATLGALSTTYLAYLRSKLR